MAAASTPSQPSAASRQPSLQLANEAAGDASAELPFSTRRPKDAVAGLSSGLKNIGKGVAGGLAGLVALPAMGAKEEGAAGFAKGLGLGLAGAVALPVTGLALGVTQIARGVFNTPEAMQENSSGKVWDQDRRIWYFYNLQEEAHEVLSVSEEEYLKQVHAEDAGEEGNSRSSADAAQTLPSRRVKDTTFYDALGIGTSATSSEIKKAYYHRARQLHPDKNPDDPAAKAKFQQLGEAYQVLADDDLRRKYDEHGRDAALENSPMMDASAFFTMIFGSDKFEPLVGELQLAMMMSVGEDPTALLSTGMDEISRVLELKQKRREVQLAVELAKRLQPFVDGDTLGFRAAIVEEAKELCGSAFGGTLVSAIGYVYVEQAEQELGFERSVAAGIGLNAISRAGHKTATGFRVARSALRTYQVAKEVERQQKDAQLPGIAGDPSAASGAGPATADANGYTATQPGGGEARESGAKSSDAPPPGSVEEAAPSLSAGDFVEAHSLSSGALNGMQGRVVGFQGERVMVEFPEGVKSLKPANLKIVQAEQQAANMAAIAGMGQHVSTLVEMLWNISVLDIEYTLRRVCFKVFKDSSVSQAVRTDRTRALLELGEVFCRSGQSPEVGLSEFTERMQAELRAGQVASDHRQGKAAESRDERSRTDGDLDSFLREADEAKKAAA